MQGVFLFIVFDSVILCSFYRQLSILRAQFKINSVMKMITYEPFYETLKSKGITTYKLIKDFNISRSLLDRLKHNRPISTVTLNDLCEILGCTPNEIIKYTKD